MTSTILPRPVPVAARADNALALTVGRARDYAEASQADNTRRAYRVGWNDFTAYCAQHGFDALPAAPRTIALYVTALAGRAKLATIRLYLAGIAEKHRETRLDSPTSHEVVRRIVRGIARTNGASQARKSAVTLDHLRAMLLEVRGDDLKATRERAIVLLGFCAALRRSEPAALHAEDLRFEKRGLIVTIRRKRYALCRARREGMAQCVGHRCRPTLPFVLAPAPNARDADRRARRCESR